MRASNEGLRRAGQRAKMPPKRRKFECTFPAVSQGIIYLPCMLIQLRVQYYNSRQHSLGQSLLLTRVYMYTQARIKKIMQLDDDVGRVASSVPIVICIHLTFSIHTLHIQTSHPAHTLHCCRICVPSLLSGVCVCLYYMIISAFILMLSSCSRDILAGSVNQSS